MSLCQIFPYGGEELWIKLALRDFPETNWLIVLANKPKPSSPALYEEVEEKERKREVRDYYREAEILVENLKKEEHLFFSLPSEKRRKFSLLDPIELENFHDVFRYFRGLLKYITDQGYKIAIHLNSGPMIWRISLYLAATEFKSNIKVLYLFEKTTGKKEDIWIHRDLTRQEKIIIDILSEKQRLSISEVQKNYQQKEKTGTLSYILKIIKPLVEEGLINEVKEGRTRWVELTSLGKSFTPVDNYLTKFKNELY